MAERQLAKYRLVEEVGRGGMAVVYRSVDTSLNREVAIKILHPYLQEEEESRIRFQREAQAVAKLHHDNIIEIYDYSGMESPESYIVTEYIKGQSLKEYIARHPIAHPEIAAMIVAEVCAALSHAHELGIIHRDIKPENIMIRDDGLIKLTDFGIAQIIDVQRLTVTGQLMGSPAYMAPELVEGRRIDHRADVFSAGTLLYQLATSELPFKGKNAHEVLKRIADGRYVGPEIVNAVVGAQLSRIIRKALAIDPDARYATIGALREDLLTYLSEAGLVDLRKELHAYFASPDDYCRDLQERLIKILTVAGQTALRQHQTSRAYECFNRVLASDPQNQEVLTLLHRLSQRRRITNVFIVLLVIAGAIAISYVTSKKVFVPTESMTTISAKNPTRIPPQTKPDFQGNTLSVPVDAASSLELSTLHTPDVARLTKKISVATTVRKAKPLVTENGTSSSNTPEVEIIPSPKAVSIWMNDQLLGNYGPDLRKIKIPPTGTTRFTFRNDACCFERVIEISAKQAPPMLRVKLPWKPARLRVTVEPAVEADVILGNLVTHPGEELEVPIPSFSDNGQGETEFKVSVPGYETETRQVTLRANTLTSVKVTLRRLP